VREVHETEERHRQEAVGPLAAATAPPFSPLKKTQRQRPRRRTRTRSCGRRRTSCWPRLKRRRPTRPSRRSSRRRPRSWPSWRRRPRLGHAAPWVDGAPHKGECAQPHAPTAARCAVVSVARAFVFKSTREGGETGYGEDVRVPFLCNPLSLSPPLPRAKFRAAPPTLAPSLALALSGQAHAVQHDRVLCVGKRGG